MIHNRSISVHLHTTILSLFMTLLLATPDTLFAVDCLTIRAKVKQEKGVIKRNKILQKAIEGCSDDLQINYFYAYNLERLRKYEQALKYYQQASQLDQQHAKSYFGIGDTQLALGHPTEAITAFKKGLSLDPDNIWAKRSMKQAQLAHQKQEESLTLTDKPVQKRTITVVEQAAPPVPSQVQKSSIPPEITDTPAEENTVVQGKTAPSVKKIIAQGPQPTVQNGKDASTALPDKIIAALQRIDNAHTANPSKVNVINDMTQKSASLEGENGINFSLH